jgi:hypothetical protein
MSPIEIAVKATARCLIVVITISSWLAISNHCAIRALATKAQTAASTCPFHSKPAKQQPEPTGTQCCKILRALAATTAKNPAPAIIDVDLSFPEFVTVAPPKISFAPLALDTGPPGKTLFAELNSSVRAHAPPFVA